MRFNFFQKLFTIFNFFICFFEITEALLRIPFSVIGRCSFVPTSHWLQAASIILQNHRRLPVSIFSVKIAAAGSLKRVTRMIFKISSDFKGARYNFEFDFHIN